MWGPGNPANEAELRASVFKDSYNCLEEYLECFKYTCAVMQTRPNLERIAYEFAVDAFDDGVRFDVPPYNGPEERGERRKEREKMGGERVLKEGFQQDAPGMLMFGQF